MIAPAVTLLEASNVARPMGARVVEISDEAPVLTDVQLDSAIAGLTHAVGLFGPNNSVTVAFDSRVVDLSLADAEMFSREVNSVMTVARYLNSVAPKSRIQAARAVVADPKAA